MYRFHPYELQVLYLAKDDLCRRVEVFDWFLISHAVAFQVTRRKDYYTAVV